MICWQWETAQRVAAARIFASAMGAWQWSLVLPLALSLARAVLEQPQGGVIGRKAVTDPRRDRQIFTVIGLFFSDGCGSLVEIVSSRIEA